ncbi:hypothetical protein DPSP01_002473 [Paraphaeosphaeria sporulosa]|uniref:Uncharacterized protein n=1 Tax=Paraphaeosphaeria sporulosa TaxID=1460663 RepID=A0A177CVW7_9PLEO|nr:uncharacterized protein CC84DRAFT_1080825 [Paraphaeosphaeria sporulosa]OAG11361.1 hypothetical protein CC84DRAFT_1080825 [Paraphaeosphaeria sporulosa]
MSHSETEVPSKAAVSRAIRDVVITIHKAGDDDNLTVNHVRTEAEQKLGLSAGFLKKDEWKNESKTMIKEAVDRYCGDEAAPEPSPMKPSKAQPKAKPEPKKMAKKSAFDNASRGVKRKAPAPAKKLHKRKKTVSSDEESEAALSDSPVEDEASDAESEPAKKPARRQKQVVAEDSDEEDVAPPKSRPQGKNEAADREEDTKRPATPPLAAKDEGGDSDLSSVIDDSPVKKRKRNTEKPAKAVSGAKAKAQPKAKAAKTEDDPDQAEIKRLQGWLVKCGIRKVWGKELAKCDTSKDKIRHLKGMLNDAGMDGKYSVEKAAKIKEQREFAKDLEEIQAGAAAWGDSISTGRPRRAAARAAPPVILAEDSDDEDEEKAPGVKDDGTDGDDDDDDVHSDSGSDDSAGGQDDEDGDEDSE